MKKQKQNFIPKIDKQDIVGNILFKQTETKYFVKKDVDWNTPKNLILRLEKIVENTGNEKWKNKLKMQ